MPKRVFWPAAMIAIGLILVASNLGMLPMGFWNLWPIILIIVGLGGLLLSDSEDWDGVKPVGKTASKVASKVVKPAAKPAKSTKFAKKSKK